MSPGRIVLYVAGIGLLNWRMRFPHDIAMFIESDKARATGSPAILQERSAKKVYLPGCLFPRNVQDVHQGRYSLGNLVLQHLIFNCSEPDRLGEHLERE